MPQHLYIEACRALVGKMTTNHRSDTCYDVSWEEPGGPRLVLPNVDTGIQCQPSDYTERQQDFQNDFIHARRAIGAAVVTATRFLEKLEPTKEEGGGSTDGLQIRLCTNQVDRGIIHIQPQQSGRAKVNMQIGTGPRRPEDAHPPNVVEFSFEDIDTAGTASPLAVVLQVLTSAGPSLLKELDRSV